MRTAQIAKLTEHAKGTWGPFRGGRGWRIKKGVDLWAGEFLHTLSCVKTLVVWAGKGSIRASDS